MRYAYALVPFGVGVWLAHYGFHFLTGARTIVPVTQSAAIDLAGAALLGEPDWRWARHAPRRGLPAAARRRRCSARMGSIAAGARDLRARPSGRAGRAAAPWMRRRSSGSPSLALWILAQPMEMRGTGLGG